MWPRGNTLDGGARGPGFDSQAWNEILCYILFVVSFSDFTVREMLLFPLQDYFIEYA